MGKSKGYLIVCSIDGDNLSSEDLAGKILDIFIYNDSEIVFIIGGLLDYPMQF